MIQQFTVKRIKEDYYSVSIDEYDTTRDTPGFEPIGSIGGEFARQDVPVMARKHDPRKSLKKDGQLYVYYACVWFYRNPAFQHITGTA